MDLLFEIGIEELPSSFIKKGMEDLSKILKENLKNNRIEFGEVKEFGTPRRLALIVSNLALEQKELNETKIGPSYDICYKDGKVTNILEKFLHSQNATLDDISIVENEKGKYIAITKFEKAKKTFDILPSILYDTILALSFDKTMKWGKNNLKFARPIKWLLSIMGDKIVKFEYANVVSSNITRGMRIEGSQEIVINTPDEYEEKLMQNYVVADRNKREQMILESIEKNCDDEFEKTVISKNLLNEVVDLVEYPYAIKGKFSEEFLKLPEDIITITMETHQRYFSVRDKNNKLSNSFVLIRNGHEYSEIVKKGNEKVIIPRLSDAEFFFNEDLKVDLEDSYNKLKRVIFQKDMGTYYEKIQRELKLAEFLINKLHLEANKEDILTTVKLSKTDLVSNVINEKEFTKLQGYMGSVYAKHKGYNDLICNGIKEHYRPYSTNETLETITGKITSVVDKLDTLVGCFLVNLIPTSSKDPFAIRRACTGIVSVLRDLNANLSYIELIDYAIDVFKENKEVLNDKAREMIINLFEDRFINSFDRENKNNYVRLFITKDKNILSLIEKSNIKLNLEEVIQITKRIENLLNKQKNENLNYDLLILNEEINIKNLIDKLNNIKDFNEFIDVILKEANIISNFFDNVKINDENKEIKENRIALLTKLLYEINRFMEI